jgi:hypothetical protein
MRSGILFGERKRNGYNDDEAPGCPIHITEPMYRCIHIREV